MLFLAFATVIHCPSCMPHVHQQESLWILQTQYKMANPTFNKLPKKVKTDQSYL